MKYTKQTLPIATHINALKNGNGTTLEIMTLRDLISTVDAEKYASNPLFLKLRKTLPEYGIQRKIVVRKKDDGIAVTNVHIGSLGDILTMPIDIDQELHISKEQLLDAILNAMSHGGFDEVEQSDFWNEMTNLQKAKLLR